MKTEETIFNMISYVKQIFLTYCIVFPVRSFWTILVCNLRDGFAYINVQREELLWQNMPGDQYHETLYGIYAMSKEQIKNLPASVGDRLLKTSRARGEDFRDCKIFWFGFENFRKINTKPTMSSFYRFSFGFYIHNYGFQFQFVKLLNSES